MHITEHMCFDVPNFLWSDLLIPAVKSPPFVPRVFLLPAVPHASASAEIVLVSGGMVQIDPVYLYIILIHVIHIYLYL